MRVHGFALGVSALALAGLATTDAEAAAPDKAICAVQQVVACSPYEPCGRALPGGVNLPVLLKLDRKAGTIVSRRETGEERMSKIGSDTEDAGSVSLQGIDEGVVWGMSVQLDTGAFTMAGATDGLGFTAFGICTSSMLD